MICIRHLFQKQRSSISSSGIVTGCTKSGFLVHTCMYRSVIPVHTEYILSTYQYILVRNAENGTYHYVCTGMYSVCTGIMTCMIAM